MKKRKTDAKVIAGEECDPAQAAGHGLENQEGEKEKGETVEERWTCLEKGVLKAAEKKEQEGERYFGAGVQNDGELKVLLEDRLEVWRAYCDRLMNVENEWNGEVEADEVFGPWEIVTVDEVAAALRKMKKGKATGPSEVGSEMLDNELCVRELCNVANEVLRGSKMPSTWRKSLVVPLYKGKGAATVCELQDY
ncbi:uncharacterized protein LOC124438761 [Xenia sp. Carnegie-2017]|uniref:uncharacterized protein LOC124438761 n=1 Tax=Xenia sp. Carnegie-2017 TaxID=2897299 RepID=UPI001F03B070|nr:uncharacterized protein LOC124438761 [Xenia sp. Carnegie-2017]